MDHVAAGIELQHGIGVGLADGLKLLGGEAQFLRQQQGRQGMPGSVDGTRLAAGPRRRGKRHGDLEAPFSG